MRRTVRARFWFEAILAALAVGLLLLTLLWRDWIERIFGVEPDGGDGSLEWVLVLVAAVLAVVAGVAARIEWRRTAPAY